jgi:hypothetical protein
MSELRTKAGRRLLAYLLVEPLVEKEQRERVVLNDILAIEDEAIALGREEEREHILEVEPWREREDAES